MIHRERLTRAAVGMEIESEEQATEAESAFLLLPINKFSH